MKIKLFRILRIFDVTGDNSYPVKMEAPKVLEEGMYNHPVIQGNKLDLQYLQTVRNTIQNLDTLRIQAIVAGLSLNLGLVASAVVCIKAFDQSPLSYFLATALLLLGGYLHRPFLRKIVMYNNFLGKAVELGLSLEKRLIREENDLFRITHAFQEVSGDAGNKGDEVFIKSVAGVGIFSCVFAVVSALFFLWESFFWIIEHYPFLDLFREL